MGKVDINKQQKKESLLNTAFELFTSKGIHNTSISDIVEKAGVAKGTFYLYFKDKYDIKQKLIAHKSGQLFDTAMEQLNQHTEIVSLEEKIIFIINNIIDALTENKTLLIFIDKDLGMGFYHSAIHSETSLGDQFHQVYKSILEKHGDHLKNPEIMIYMIIELVGSTCYSSILYDEPVSITELKPHLFQSIRNIIKDYTI